MFFNEICFRNLLRIWCMQLCSNSFWFDISIVRCLVVSFFAGHSVNMIHSLNITSWQVSTLPVRLIFALLSACGLYFRPFKPKLGLRPWFRPAAFIFGPLGLNLACDLDTSTALQRSRSLAIMMLIMHHRRDVFMTSQPIAVQTETSLFYRIDICHQSYLLSTWCMKSCEIKHRTCSEMFYAYSSCNIRRVGDVNLAVHCAFPQMWVCNVTIALISPRSSSPRRHNNVNSLSVLGAWRHDRPHAIVTMQSCQTKPNCLSRGRDHKVEAKARIARLRPKPRPTVFKAAAKTKLKGRAIVSENDIVSYGPNTTTKARPRLKA